MATTIIYHINSCFRCVLDHNGPKVQLRKSGSVFRHFLYTNGKVLIVQTDNRVVNHSLHKLWSGRSVPGILHVVQPIHFICQYIATIDYVPPLEQIEILSINQTSLFYIHKSLQINVQLIFITMLKDQTMPSRPEGTGNWGCQIP